MTINLTVGERNLIIEALQARASRHESMARANPRGAKRHDDAAAAMRKLRGKIQQTK